MNNKNFDTITDTELQQINGGGSPIFYGANGYLTKQNGRYTYVVTKSPLQATLDVIVNGWTGAASGGFGLRR